MSNCSHPTETTDCISPASALIAVYITEPMISPESNTNTNNFDGILVNRMAKLVL